MRVSMSWAAALLGLCAVPLALSGQWQVGLLAGVVGFSLWRQANSLATVELEKGALAEPDFWSFAMARGLLTIVERH